MVNILFKILFSISIIIIIFSFFLYFKSSKRKLNKALKLKKYYFLDDLSSNNKNLKIAYKGILFEGEKHLGTLESAFRVVSIHMSTLDTFDLHGFSRIDLVYLEDKIKIHYNVANIKWNHPLNQIV